MLSSYFVPSHIMPVQLKPEIYRLIVKALILPDDQADSDIGNDRETPVQSPQPSASLIQGDRQALLANLMRVSPVSTTIREILPY